MVPYKGEEVYLLKEFERGVDEVGYKFPSGHFGFQEEPKEAAERELKEELGMDAGKISYVGETFVNPGFNTQRCYYFLFEELTQKESARGAYEVFNGGWVNWKDLENLVSSGKIRNQFVLSAFAKLGSRLS